MSISFFFLISLDEQQDSSHKSYYYIVPEPVLSHFFCYLLRCCRGRVGVSAMDATV